MDLSDREQLRAWYLATLRMLRTNTPPRQTISNREYRALRDEALARCVRDYMNFTGCDDNSAIKAVSDIDMSVTTVWRAWTDFQSRHQDDPKHEFTERKIGALYRSLIMTDKPMSGAAWREHRDETLRRCVSVLKAQGCDAVQGIKMLAAATDCSEAEIIETLKRAT